PRAVRCTTPGRRMDPAWITAITALAVALVSLGTWGGRWAVRLLIATHDFLTDWPKMKTAITGLQQEIAEVHADRAAQHHELVLQQRASVILGEKLCTTFGTLAALKPPPGNPAKNLSRAFEDNLHTALDQLGTDLGCKSASPP